MRALSESVPADSFRKSLTQRENAVDKYYVFMVSTGIEVYWTGEFTPRGTPSQTVSTLLARPFSRAREAYAAAGEHKELRRWKVGARPDAMKVAA